MLKQLTQTFRMASLIQSSNNNNIKQSLYAWNVGQYNIHGTLKIVGTAAIRP